MIFEDTLDEELLYLYKCKAQDMAYYQHAEAEAYWREKNLREKCSAELALIRKELYARGVEVPVVGYLV